MIQINTQTDMLKNNLNGTYDHMNNFRKGLCKNKCLAFKATKPVNGARYASGQVRCQTCEIFLTPEGVKDNLHCKCCNFRVRSRPRNSAYKERYFENIKNADSEKNNIDSNHVQKNNSDTQDENWWLEESSKKRLEVEESQSEKKESPIYEPVDESKKTYYEFKEFLESEIKLQSNYQLVMLKELLEYGRLHKGEISESLAYFNNKDSSEIDVVRYYFNVPVYGVLLKHGFIIEDGFFKNNDTVPYYVINVILTENQKFSMLEYLQQKLDDYNTEHNILENSFPEANNMGSIDWDLYHHNISKKIDNVTLNKNSESNDTLTKKQNFIQTSEPKKSSSVDTMKIDFINTESRPYGISVNKFKKINTEFIRKYDVLTNDEIMESFHVGNMGGIRYTRKSNTLVLLSTYSDDYDDSIDSETGLVIYTGEGKGDQELTNGNEKILNSKNNSMVLFKEVYQEPGVRKRGALDNKYEFIGIVNYKKHYWKSEKNRKVVKFVLEVVS